MEFSTEKDAKMISDEEDIESSLNILLSTRLGERVMNTVATWMNCSLKGLQEHSLPM